jgi:glutamine amidotransferase PdxT
MIMIASSAAVGISRNVYGSAAEETDELLKIIRKLSTNDESRFIMTPQLVAVGQKANDLLEF